MSDEEFKRHWVVDYWKPGHPVYDHYNSQAFKDQRKKSQADIVRQWEKEEADRKKAFEEKQKPLKLEFETPTKPISSETELKSLSLINAESTKKLNYASEKKNTMPVSYYFLLAICLSLTSWLTYQSILKHYSRTASFLVNFLFMVSNLFGWYYFVRWVFGAFGE